MTFKRKSKGHLESLRSNLKDQGRNEGGGKILGKGKCPRVTVCLEPTLQARLLQKLISRTSLELLK